MSIYPKISVVVITYNQQSTIERTLDSILAQQTEYIFEIIIGEDCSMDSTREICLRYVENYPQKIRLMPVAPNKGVLINFRDTIMECRGEYISQCAGDDWWHNPNKLQIEVDFMEQNVDYGMVHSDIDLYDAETNKITPNFNRYQHKCIPDGFYAPHLLTQIIPIYTPTPCYRKKLIDKVNFNEFRESVFLMEDLPMWLEMSRYAKFYYIDTSLCTYTSAFGSACRPDSIEKHLAFERNVTKVQLYYRNKYYSEIVAEREIIEAESYRLMHVYRRFDKYAEAYKIYKKMDFGSSLLRRISQKSYMLYRILIKIKDKMNKLS